MSLSEGGGHSALLLASTSNKRGREEKTEEEKVGERERELTYSFRGDVIIFFYYNNCSIHANMYAPAN